MNSTEAEKLLEGLPSGTFLVRFHECRSNKFSIAVNINERIGTLLTCSLTIHLVHHQIISSKEGFSLEDAVGKVSKSIAELVSLHHTLCTFPYTLDISRQR